MSLTSQHTQYSLVTNNGKDWTQIINIFIASLSSLSFGMALAWTSPFIDKIANGTQNYNITKNELIFIAPIAPATTMIASPIVTGLNDKIGRKWMVMAISLPYATFWIVTVFAKDAKMFYVSRIFVGIGDAILYTTLALYIGEILTPKVRGVWSNTVVTANNLGVLLVNIIGFYFTVQVTAYISLSAPAMLILLMTFMPESPYYNIMKKRYTAAEKNLRFLRCTENVNDEFLQIKAAVERQMSENGGWNNLIKIKSNRKAVFISLFLKLSQGLTGFFPFLMFTMTIFEESVPQIGKQISTWIYIGILTVVGIFAAFGTEKFGRRKCFTVSTFVCGLLLVVLSIFFYIDQKTNFDIKFLNWIPLVGMLVYSIVAAFGIMVVPTLMSTELFSTSIKTKAISVFSISHGFTIFLSQQLFSFLELNCGISVVFFSAGVIAL